MYIKPAIKLAARQAITNSVIAAVYDNYAFGGTWLCNNLTARADVHQRTMTLDLMMLCVVSLSTATHSNISSCLVKASHNSYCLLKALVHTNLFTANMSHFTLLQDACSLIVQLPCLALKLYLACRAYVSMGSQHCTLPCRR